jgi:hypothetical protein
LLKDSAVDAEYWRERADRVRKTADFVDEESRKTLLRIAGNYEHLAQRAKAGDRIKTGD